MAAISDQTRRPSPGGLYAADHEHDACGVALLADLTGRRDHAIVQKAITALLRLEHRGARGAEPNTGDGAGILIQVPDAFYRDVVDFELPPEGTYATGIAMLPTGDGAADAVTRAVDELAAEENLRVLGWRDIPTDPDAADLGSIALAAMPVFRQLFVTAAESSASGTSMGTDAELSGIDLERRTFCLRKRIEHTTDAYFA